MRRSAAAGVASVEHAWLADRAALEALAASGAFLVPTMVVDRRQPDARRPDPGPARAPGHDRAPPARIDRDRHRARRSPSRPGPTPARSGVTADMVWREIVLLHDHGASPMAAIRRRPRPAARLLGLDADLGTVEVGQAGRPRPRRRRPADRPSPAGRPRARPPRRRARLGGRLGQVDQRGDPIGRGAFTPHCRRVGRRVRSRPLALGARKIELGERVLEELRPAFRVELPGFGLDHERTLRIRRDARDDCRPRTLAVASHDLDRDRSQIATALPATRTPPSPGTIETVSRLGRPISTPWMISNEAGATISPRARR